ncbi:MAG: hypothetical protein D8H97_38895 [Neisseria sp.]|nr:MAG: hypothetical protein D8H97_38895 [Neisseria sp.]
MISDIVICSSRYFRFCNILTIIHAPFPICRQKILNKNQKNAKIPVIFQGRLKGVQPLFRRPSDLFPAEKTLWLIKFLPVNGVRKPLPI